MNFFGRLKNIPYSMPDPDSFWRRFIGLMWGQGLGEEEYVRFRLDLNRICAVRQTPPDGIPSRSLEQIFSTIAEQECTIHFSPQASWHPTFEELAVICGLVKTLQPA